MSLPAKRLNTSQSEGGLSINSNLPDSRREKLLNMKKREELKDKLTDKFKDRFGHGSSNKEASEVSVSSSCIRREVDSFAKTAAVTSNNLGRLERRIQSRAKKNGDAVSCVTGISAYSGASQKSHSVASLAGRSVVQSACPESFDWSRLDEYASYLHEQDALRQKLGVHALQKKLRMDLDQQVEEKKCKQDAIQEEERRYHQNSLVELERWKEAEQAREEERHAKLMREKNDRDAQLEFERKLKRDEEQRKKDEEANLVDKIVTEMEAEQKKAEKKKEATKKSMRKVFEENAADQMKRMEAQREQKEKESAAMKQYNRILDEQEEQRAAELAARMEKQGELMKKLQSNVAAVQKGAGDNDAQRAKAQQDEMDRHFFESEAMKQRRLQELRLQNQAYLLKQMEDKDMRKDDDKHLENIQAQILQKDTAEYEAIEAKKVVDRRSRNIANRKDIEKQMQYKHSSSVPAMSTTEIKLNKPLLNLVNKTLASRDEGMPLPTVEEEDY
mmetsp:Transcript_1018/g.2265  ORF Transcript_1018/g.2265 Transcript_1018/m.2265 type:complete len:502 (-) Transcript_1018:130-1635(-)